MGVAATPGQKGVNWSNIAVGERVFVLYFRRPLLMWLTRRNHEHGESRRKRCTKSDQQRVVRFLVRKCWRLSVFAVADRVYRRQVVFRRS